MFIIRGAMLTVCPTKKYRTKVNDLITRSKLGLSAGRTVASALRLPKSTRRAARPPGTQLTTVSWRVSGCGFNRHSLLGTRGLERRHAPWCCHRSLPTKPLLPFRVGSALP